VTARLAVKLVWTFVLVATLIVASKSTTEFVYAAF
jgi:hypothetical protein